MLTLAVRTRPWLPSRGRGTARAFLTKVGLDTWAIRARPAGEGVRIPGDMLWQKLQRHETVEARVLSLVNHAHAPATELFFGAVMRDGLANHCGDTAALSEEF